MRIRFDAFVATRRHARGHLGQAFQHPMCHMEKFSADARSFNEFHREVFKINFFRRRAQWKIAHAVKG
jgi:hypothetical protein